MTQVRNYRITLDVEISADILGNIQPADVAAAIHDLMDLHDRDHQVYVGRDEIEVDMRVSTREAVRV